MRRALLGLLLLVFATLLASCGGSRELNGIVFQQPRQLDFTLTDVASNRPFKAAELDGQVALVFFGYTFCPDICPTTMGEFLRVKEQLGGRAENVRFVMITVDPERDTPERLARYVASFDSSFLGLRGDIATTERLTSTYGIAAEKREVAGSQAGYLVDHTALAFLIDKQGYMRAGYSPGTDAELIVEDVRTLLAE